MTTSSADRPLFSVIVPVFNDADGLRRCLEALDRQTVPKDWFEVIVVDNGSHHPMDPVVTPFKFACCITEAMPGSYAARNTGVGHADGTLLAFTDADCQPRPDWLEHAAKIFMHDPGVSAIGGAIELDVSPDRSVAELYELVLSPFPQESFIKFGGFAATANLVVRASVFRSVGPFKETLLSSGDREWGSRLIAAGFKLQFSAQCAVLHPTRKTVRALIRKRRRIEGGVLRFAAIQNDGDADETMPRLHPPRFQLAQTLLFRPKTMGLGRWEGVQVLALAALLVAVRIIEGLRLRLGGQPAR